jgi:hypothetical protein
LAGVGGEAAADGGAVGKRCVFEYKKQIAFVKHCHAGETAGGPDSKKFFGSFFQKRTSCLPTVADPDFGI